MPQINDSVQIKDVSQPQDTSRQQSVSQFAQDALKAGSDPNSWNKQPGDITTSAVDTSGQGALYQDSFLPSGMSSANFKSELQSASNVVGDVSKLMSDVGALEKNNNGQPSESTQKFEQSALDLVSNILKDLQQQLTPNGDAGTATGSTPSPAQEGTAGKSHGNCHHGTTGTDGGTPTTGTDGGTPTTGTDGGTPTTGTDSGTPTTGTDSGTPTTTTDGGTPTTGTDSGTPTTGTDSGTPTTGTDSGTPTTGTDGGTPTTTTDGGTPTTGTDGGKGTTSGGPATNDGTGFQTQNGQLRVNGQLISGIAVTGEYVQQVGAGNLVQELKSNFPGINTVRLATSPSGGAFTRGGQLGGGQSIADVENTAKTLTAAGFGVIIDNHDSDANQQPNIPTYNATESQWFGQLASDLKNNSMVMYQSGNEPIPSYNDGTSNQQVVDEQQNVYNAVRSAGSNQVVAFDLIGGGGADALQSNPAAYNKDYNYAIDAHAYTFQDSNWQSNVQGELNNIASANLTESNTGEKAPVYFGEVGVSGNTPADQNTPDATDQGLLKMVTTDGTGAISWLLDGAATGWNDPNHLTLPGNGGDGPLSSYGQLWNNLTANGTS